MIREHRVIIQGEPLHCAQLAEACLAAGDLDAAREAVEEGIAAGQRIGARFYEGRARLALAAAGIAQHGVPAEQEIRGILDETEAIFQKAQARNWQPFIHEQRSLLAKAMEDDAGYEHEREEAKRLFAEMGSSGHVRRLEQA